jgi:hypothetical protein
MAGSTHQYTFHLNPSGVDTFTKADQAEMAAALDALAQYAAGDRVTADDDLAVCMAEALVEWVRDGEITPVSHASVAQAAAECMR